MPGGMQGQAHLPLGLLILFQTATLRLAFVRERGRLRHCAHVRDHDSAENRECNQLSPLPKTVREDEKFRGARARGATMRAEAATLVEKFLGEDKEKERVAVRRARSEDAIF
jgi:hypothetical protein